MTDDQQLPEDALADLCADLLSEQRYEPCLKRLFSEPPGRWQELATLTRGCELAPLLANAERRAESATRVAWLEFPDSEHGSGYVAVVFFSEAVFGRVWTYNRDRLLRSATGDADVTGA